MVENEQTKDLISFCFDELKLDTVSPVKHDDDENSVFSSQADIKNPGGAYQ
jgi:hypothetical protein